MKFIVKKVGELYFLIDTTRGKGDKYRVLATYPREEDAEMMKGRLNGEN